jgi:TPR repeat protein
MMKLTPIRGVILAALFVIATTPAFAGLDDGLAAYDRGDFLTAYRELAPAAAGGAPAAQYAVARMYLSGEGVPRDGAEGLKWLRKAALAGVGVAQYQLGAYYEWGVEVPQDYSEAARWYRMAADRGVPVAQYRLGLLYLRGFGVAKDLVAAHMWLNLASSRLPPGEPRNAVAKLRESVAGEMTATEIAQAQVAARNWTPATDR